MLTVIAYGTEKQAYFDLFMAGYTRISRFVSELGYDPSLSRPTKDFKNYTLKAFIHLGKVFKYAVR